MARIERIHWYLLTGAVLCLLTAGALVTLTRGYLLVALAPLGAALLIGAVSLLLHRESKRVVEQDRVLLTISEGLATRLELGDLLDHIVRTILQSVPLADKCVIHLLDERGRRLFPRYSSRPDWERALGMPANRGIAGQALNERRTVVVNDVRREREFLVEELALAVPRGVVAVEIEPRLADGDRPFVAQQLAEFVDPLGIRVLPPQS